MRYGKIFVCIFTALLFAVAVYIGVRDPAPEAEAKEIQVLLSAAVITEDGEEEIDCWKNGSADYYVFLPSYADLSQVQLRLHTDNEIYIEGQQVTEGMTCENYQLDTVYDLSYTEKGESYSFSLTFVQSGNMPAMYIDVQSGSLEYIRMTKGNKEPGAIRLYTAEGELNHAGNLESIGGRGNYTWGFEKSPFSLNLTSEADLLGMGQAKRWILLANAVDRSHLRNKIAYDFADAAGLAYSPECQWVDLYLNGEYFGLYLLCERNEVHEQRVNISGERTFLVSKEFEWRMDPQETPYITTASKVTLRIRSSTVDEDTLLQIWQSLEDAILDEDGIDPATGKHWLDMIDLDSWARKYLVEEIFGNIDAGVLSQYYYSDGDRIYAGPVWDFDLSIKNPAVWQLRMPNSLFACKPAVLDAADSPWYYEMYHDETFYTRVVELYEAEFRPLLTQLLETGIDDYVSQISQAAVANQIRWNSKDHIADTEALVTYMTERMAFLDSLWLEEEEYCFILVNIADGTNTAYYALRPGEMLPELPVYEDTDTVTYLGWYNMETEEPFDVTQPIYEDTMIYLKQYVPEAAEESFLREAIRYVPAAALVMLLLGVCFADMLRARKNTAKEKDAERQLPAK